MKTDAEQYPHSQIEYLGEQSPMERIVSLQSHTGHDVKLADKRRQERDIGYVELAVRIHEHDEVTCRRAETRRQRAAVAFVPFMVNRANTRIVASEIIDDFRSPISTAIVDDDDLERGGEFRQNVDGLFDDVLNILFFVVRWQDERQTARQSHNILRAPLCCGSGTHDLNCRHSTYSCPTGA